MLNLIDRLLFVRQVPLFEELRDDFLMRLASVMEELDFPENHTIFHKGEEGESMYIVVSGRVKIHIGDRIIAEPGSGKCFGEMAIVDAEPRSASVTTLEPCECLLLTQQQLYEAIDEMPSIAVNLLRLLSRRIREANDLSNAKAAEPNPNQANVQAPSYASQPYVSATGAATTAYETLPWSPVLPLN